MRFQGQRTGKGTGWLVDSRTIATAGHCVYDPNLGFLEWVKVTFGSETENPIELHGTHAVVHWCYYVAFSGKSDLGFIRLESSVVGVSPLSFTSTPWKSSTGGELTARGYPNVSDQPERMRESKCEAKYNLLDTDWSLEYELATDRGMWRLHRQALFDVNVEIAGSSGCPIFDQDRNVIGTHSRVDIAKGSHRRGKLINKGVIIDARDNNPAAFCAVLDHLVSKDKLDDRDPKGRSDPRFVARPMSNGVTGYTVHR
jgi:V8-like Glu-specific endopeptidase